MEEQVKQEVPIGVVGKPSTTPNIAWQQFFALKQTTLMVLDFINQIEQQELKNGNLKYYFKADTVERVSKDDKGKPIKNEKGEEVKYLDLVDTFWNPPSQALTVEDIKPKEEITPNNDGSFSVAENLASKDDDGVVAVQ